MQISLHINIDIFLLLNKVMNQLRDKGIEGKAARQMHQAEKGAQTFPKCTSQRRHWVIGKIQAKSFLMDGSPHRRKQQHWESILP